MRIFLLLPLLVCLRTTLPGQTPQNPFVYNGLAISLGDQNSVSVNARQLVVRPDNSGCFTYAFSADPADSLTTLTCTEMGTNQLTVWTLPTGTSPVQPARVETYVILQDNQGVCVGGAPPGALPVWVMNGLSKTITANSQIYVCVEDFLVNRNSGFEYAIRRSGTGTGFPMSGGFPAWVIPFSCDELGFQPVEIWARDSTGAEGFAESYVMIQDLLEVCDFPSAGAGLPSVQLHHGLAATFDLGGTVRLRARDMQRRSVLASPDCPLYFSFSADLSDTIRTFDYATDLGINLVEVWATDSCTGLQSTGEAYLLLQDNSPASGCNSLAAAPCNDDRTDAVVLDLASDCWQYFSTRHATTEPAEPEPASGACSDPNTWCDATGADNSVWFTFTAPPSGSVELTTARLNTQIAVWQEVGTDFFLIGANDDAPNAAAGESALLLTCLAGGATYYLQVDGFDGAEGQFALRAVDAGVACLVSGDNVGAASCGEIAIGAVTSTGTGAWQHFTDANGKVAVSLNDRGQALGTVTVEFKLHGGAGLRVDSAGTPYLDRNWTVVTENAPAGPVRLRLYATAGEFQTLAADPAGPATPEETFATKVASAVCADYTTGGTLLSPALVRTANTAGDLAFEFDVDGFSSFYLHGPGQLTPTSGAAAAAASLIVWPNPVTDRFSIRDLPAGQYSFRVLDAVGREVQRGELPDGNSALSAGHWAPGVYSICVENEGLRTIAKLVKL